jgi:hypothetical protein
MNPLQTTRRDVLRGAGVMLALPWMESLTSGLVSAAAAPANESAMNKPPVRFAVLFFPNGVWKDNWIPKQSGSDYELPFALTPLAGLKNDITVFSNLDKAHSRGGDGHYAKTANFLTGLRVAKTTGKNINVGNASVDQIIAAKLGHRTPLPSLELGIDPVISGIDSNVGYTRLYGSYISWRSASVPVAREINPKMVYERLFGSAARPDEDDRSLLDLTLEDAKALRSKLGRDDQFKLDEYLDSMRAVEKRIAFAAKPDPDHRPAKDLAVPGAPKPGIPRDHAEHVKLMLDLMALAFWSDSTRVITFMFANDVSGKNFSFVEGVRGGHHDLSHHSNQKDKIEQYSRINRWHAEQFAYLANKLKGIKEGTGTLLDNSMLLLGSSMSDGNAHDPNNLPIVVAGKAGGAFKTGQHLASRRGTPLCNLYLSILEASGVKAPRFGDSTGPLKGLS